MKHLQHLAAAAIAWIIVDGDTVKAPYGVTYRVLGYDAPETHFAKCEAERRLGHAATRRFEALLSSGEVTVRESGRIDKYGRTLATVYVNGRNVSEIMIAEGFARAYDGGKRQGWCP
ncbi:MAG: thermonuclease family protein [Hyphomicrobiales bacterium]|nr:thermonuclease family protein [Hyphomicrobiales bacterium]